jgi:hypothetical protein
MLTVKADFDSIVQGLQSLGLVLDADDDNAISSVVLYLGADAQVELANLNGVVAISFEVAGETVECAEYDLFVEAEEHFGYEVVFTSFTTTPVTHSVTLTKGSSMSKVNTPSIAPIQLNAAEFQTVMALASQATANATAANTAFLAMLETMKLVASSSADAVTLANKTAADAADRVAAIELEAKTKIEAAAADATAEVKRLAEQCKLMAEAIDLQRRAAAVAAGQPSMTDLQREATAANAASEGSWYTSTPAKVVGGMAAVAAVAAAGYYGYQHWTANTQ